MRREVEKHIARHHLAATGFLPHGHKLGIERDIIPLWVLASDRDLEEMEAVRS